MNFNRSKAYVNNINSHIKKRKKIRRLRKSKKPRHLSDNFKVVSVNAASLKAKLFSFENLILDYEPSVFGIQETHFQKKGQMKFQSSEKYQIYELTRERRGGGGLALGVKNASILFG